MAVNIIERMTGYSEGDPLIRTDPEWEKLVIHAFLGALNEFHRGKMTGGEISSLFNLTAAQQQQTIAFVDLLDAAPQPTEFMRVMKDWMYMGEINLEPKYSHQPDVIQRMQDEVTDQGGTLP